MSDIRVTVWNEFRHEKHSDHAASTIYPKGMHVAISDYLNKQSGIKATTATLDEPEHGLTEKKLAETDVLTWWGHMAHHEVQDDIVERVVQRVWQGMGIIVLHSGHFSKVFKRLMGTSCDLKWREADEKQRFWVIEPGHPIANGLEHYFELPKEEMYGERFDIPAPDELVFVSWFEGGEVFRSGCCWTRQKGRIFYFQPGHESYPTYFDENILKVIANGVRWANPQQGATQVYGHCQPLEKIG